MSLILTARFLYMIEWKIAIRFFKDSFFGKKIIIVLRIRKGHPWKTSSLFFWNFCFSPLLTNGPNMIFFVAEVVNLANSAKFAIHLVNTGKHYTLLSVSLKLIYFDRFYSLCYKSSTEIFSNLIVGLYAERFQSSLLKHIIAFMLDDFGVF